MREDEEKEAKTWSAATRRKKRKRTHGFVREQHRRRGDGAMEQAVLELERVHDILRHSFGELLDLDAVEGRFGEERSEDGDLERGGEGGANEESAHELVEVLAADEAFVDGGGEHGLRGEDGESVRRR